MKFMFLENSNLKEPKDKEIMALKTSNTDPLSLHMTGDIIDRIYKKGVFVEERVGHNLVVNSLLNLVMCLLKQQSGYIGLQYWAVGSGASSWDTQMPSPNLEDTRLTSEIGRVPLLSSDFAFLNEESEVVNAPTNILQVSHTFGENDCNGVWREFGIFGGNATATFNSGIIINKRHHPILTKTSDMQIERVMRFTLNLV